MSAGWSGYVVESAEAIERRLLAQAQARRRVLHEELDVVNRRIALVGGSSGTHADTGSTSNEVAADCARLEGEVERVRAEWLRIVDAERQELTQRLVGDILVGLKVSDDLVAGLGTMKSRRTTAVASTVDPRRDAVAERAAYVLRKLRVPDQAIASAVGDAASEEPARALLLLADLSTQVDRVNRRLEEERQREAEERAVEMQAFVDAAGDAADQEYVADAVIASLAAIGYHAVGTEDLDGEEHVVLKHQGFAHHGVAAAIGGKRIKLEPVRLSGAPDRSVDQQFEETMCAGLKEFEQHLSARGVRRSATKHRPAGFSLIRRSEVAASPQGPRWTAERKREA